MRIVSTLLSPQWLYETQTLIMTRQTSSRRALFCKAGCQSRVSKSSRSQSPSRPPYPLLPLSLKEENEFNFKLRYIYDHISKNTLTLFFLVSNTFLCKTSLVTKSKIVLVWRNVVKRVSHNGLLTLF